jgi:Tol biopolymer transport system component
MRKGFAALLTILISGCNDQESLLDPGRQLRTRESASRNVAVCDANTFGPRTFTRAAGQPIDESFVFAANPDAEYVLTVTDNGSRGSTAELVLNGVSLLPPGLGGSATFDWSAGVNLVATNSMTVRLTGQPASTLTVAIRCTSTPPVSPRDVVFQSTRDGNFEIYSMRSDGTDELRLTNDPADDFEPSWSPTRDRVAFASSRAGGFQIFTMNADGSNATQLTHGSINRAPQWSPDGSKILFYSDRNGFHQIFVMEADGQNQHLVIEFWSYDPVWSPDGNQIAFSGDQTTGGATQDIWTANADGTNRVRLTTDPAIDYTPSWSPDGTRIAFASERVGGVEDVFVMDTNGANQIRLTTDGAADFLPWWSPDGARIMFSSNRSGRYQIYVMSSSGAGLAQVTNKTGDNYGVNWR